MTMRSTLWALSLLATACASNAGSSGAEEPAATAAASAAEIRAPEATGAPDSSAAAASNATASTAPSEPASNEAAKDPSALVIEVVFAQKGGAKLDDATTVDLMKAFQDRVAKSSKLATPASKGVTAPRRVMGTFMIEAPITDAKGLTVKMGLNGIEPAGKCPLFDLDQKLTMSGGKNTPADILELRKAAVVALLEKLEPTAPSLKPAANCTPFKK